MARRSVGDQVDEEAIPALSRKTPKRDRSWEAEQRKQPGVKTYRGVPDALHANLLTIARELQVRVGEVARAFLEYALEAYETGDLVLHPEPRGKRNTLFPDEFDGQEEDV